MKTRKAFRAGLVLVVGLGFTTPGLTRAEQQPNLILIISDDAGYADFGFMGGEAFQTPHLDKLAATGVMFKQAYAGPTCSPSRCGLLTGHYAQRHGFGRNCGARFDVSNDGFPKGVKTLPMYLKELGYTSGVIGKWHQGAVKGVNQPLDLGFDEFWGLLGGSRSYFGNAKGANAIWRNRTPDPDWVTGASELLPDPKKGRYITDAMGDEAISMLERFSKRNKPFFLYLSFTAPHTPMQAKQQDLAQFPELKGQRKVQAAMQLAMDRACGRVLHRLKSLGESENTYILFINDNGGSNHSTDINGHLRGYKGSVYEGGVRVPMILSGPGIPVNTMFDPPVVHRDILPTFVELAGGSVEGSLDGVSLLSFVKRKMPTVPHSRIFHRHVHAGVAVRKGDWKLVNPTNPGEHGTNDPGVWELYNLKADPSEKNDRASQNPEIVDQLKQDIAEWEGGLAKNRWGQFGRQDRNYFDRFTFLPESGPSWFGKQAWQNSDDSEQVVQISCQDVYPNAELAFPLQANAYEADNDLYSASGLDAMLNRLVFTGEGQVKLTGNPLRFVSSLAGGMPSITVPKNGKADISLSVESDAELAVYGKGAICFRGGLKAHKLSVDVASFDIKCNMEVHDLVISSETFSIDRSQHISGSLRIVSGVSLDIRMKAPPEAGTVIFDAGQIIGTFRNSMVTVNGTKFQVRVEKNRIVLR